MASARVLELIGRAALASEVAGRTERPPEPFAHAGSDAVAAELYREAMHWALAAHAELRGSRADADDTADAPQDTATSPAALLDRIDAALLGRVAASPEELAQLRADLGGSYREFGELEPDAQRKLVERLERASQLLLEPLGTLSRRLERIWVRRVVNVFGVLLLALGVFFAGRQLLRSEERGHDLAARANWTTSSRYAQGGCESPKQDCAGGENYFFHTMQENEPWVMFDLGKERRISTVEVDNRLDCCTDRATPLVIEVSPDKKRWREVARHTGEFATLRESFDSVRVRYVRLRIAAPNAILHLSRVRIYP